MAAYYFFSIFAPAQDDLFSGKKKLMSMHLNSRCVFFQKKEAKKNMFGQEEKKKKWLSAFFP